MTIFTDAVNRLTLIYVSILMVVSLTASLAVYKIADNQFDVRLRRQQAEFLLRQGPINILRDLDEIRLREQREARADLVLGLLIFNLAVLAGGTYLSHYAARTTLRPIKDVMDAQNRFTADASHELRTPLSSMKSEIEVALRGNKITASEAKQLLKSNLEEVDNLEMITSALLELARTPSGGLGLVSISLDKVVSDSVKQLAKSAQDSRVKIKVATSSNHNVLAEASTLKRLICILLDNAIKYSAAGGSVRVLADDHKNKIKISIADDGVGIKKQEQQKIFDRFYRADKSRTKTGNKQGYGLGLSIASHIASQLGTHIEVDSKPGKGSVFSFWLKTV